MTYGPGDRCTGLIAAWNLTGRQIKLHYLQRRVAFHAELPPLRRTISIHEIHYHHRLCKALWGKVYA